TMCQESAHQRLTSDGSGGRGTTRSGDGGERAAALSIRGAHVPRSGPMATTHPADERQDGLVPADSRTTAQLVGRLLAELGASHVFGVLGSGNLLTTNAMVAAGVPYTAARHEGGAICMASGY